MKKYIISIATLASFVMEAALNAQSYALPKTNRPNLTFQIGPTYMDSKNDVTLTGGMFSESEASGRSRNDFLGMNAAFGWRIDRHNTIQLELGVLGTSDRGSLVMNHPSLYSDTNPPSYIVIGPPSYRGITISEDTIMIPLLASYSFCIPFAKNDRYEFRISPTFGFVCYYKKLEFSEIRDISPLIINGGASDNSIVPAYGVGLGFTWHIIPKLYLDFGYRYLRVSDAKMRFSGYDGYFLDAPNTPITFGPVEGK